MATDIWDLSDEELEAAFLEAKDSGVEVEYDEDTNDDDYEEVANLEQPENNEQDSDDDASLEDEEEDESDEESTEEEVELDGDDEESEDDEPTEEEAEFEDEEQPVQKYKFKANGRDYEFSTDEILNQFPKIFGQAMDYTKKTQAIKPWRKTIDALESANLGHDDINLMIDVLKGDKDAIAEVMKRTGVDALDLDTENSYYIAKDYGRDGTALDIKDVIEDISGDVEYTKTQKILGKEWDDASWEEMKKTPQMIKELHIDVKSGMFDIVQPIADKIKLQDGGRQSDLEYYKQAAGVYFSERNQETNRQQMAEAAKQERERKQAEQKRIADVKAKQQKAKATQQDSVKRKAAAPTAKRAGTKKVIDYLDDSDEAFDDWYKEHVEGKM